MRATGSHTDVKRMNRINVLRYLLRHGSASRQELATALGFSLPTVFQIVTDLTERGLVCEVGEYGSTGGRKAKILAIQEGKRCVVGVEVTKGHLQMVLMDFSKRLLDAQCLALPYENTPEYYTQMGSALQEFVQHSGAASGKAGELIGVGLSLPGTVDKASGLLRSSIILNVFEMNMLRFAQNIPYPVCFYNNARSAVFAEAESSQQNMVYLCLNYTVGGGAYLGGSAYTGDNLQNTVIGHMVISANGKKCYCGKRGCLNAYCSSLVLTRNGEQTLEQFFEDLDNGDPENAKVWDTYLEYLALGITNLRLIFDCDILLGGAVSEFLKTRMNALREKILRYTLFDYDASFVRLGRYNREVFAVGAAQLMVDQYICESDLLSD